MPGTLPATTNAAILLLAASLSREHALPAATVEAILGATGASKTGAYLALARLQEVLGSVVRGPGRPPKAQFAPTPPPPPLAQEVLEFLMRHPGAVSGSERRRYSDAFRRFVLDLLARNKGLPLREIAEAIRVPAPTLKDWLAGGAAAVDREPRAEPADRGPAPAQIATVLDEWSRWNGRFVPFVAHIQEHCRVPLGRTAITTILEMEGVRLRKTRVGRSPDEDAMRARFETFFPHAQWVQDGWQVPVTVGGERFDFNVELAVDAYSGGFVGVGISRHEDSEVVLATVHDGLASAGTSPIAILLDNKSCNHTQAVEEGAAPSLLIPATLNRPQNKGHVEGAFGLLEPTLKGLELNIGPDIESTARSFLRALLITAGRAWNGRPRADREGRSRLDLLEDRPTPEQLAAARAQLQELLLRQRTARLTKAARQDPVVRKMLQDAYLRLGLDDPTGNLVTATASYPLEAIVEGIGIWEGKKRAGTLPEKVGGDYLLGIVRNVSQEREAWEIALALWELRGQAQDELAARLDRTLERLDDELERAGGDDEERLKSYVDRATKTSSRSERFFWLQTAADLVRDGADPADQRARFQLVARRIAATHALPPRDRNAAVRFLAARCRPID
jgi:DNA-binding transcriptional MerR regulator